jgi:hypothetical protein
LCSLPATHQTYLFEKVLNLCSGYIRTNRIPVAELTPGELVSEVWLKLLGTVSVGDQAEIIPARWIISSDAPERDGRVVWLIQEIGGFDAIRHRHEDILRQRFGRSLRGRGRPIVQFETDDEPELTSEPDPSTLGTEDAHRVWRGLLATADQQFQRQDDVMKLLRLMDKFRDVLENSSGQWPVKVMVAMLNAHFPPPTWTDDRVDNAKRRLVKWIKGLMQKNGLDATDLEALFAGAARRIESYERGSFTEIRRPN